MNLKDSKNSFMKKNMNPNDYVHCWVIGCWNMKERVFLSNNQDGIIENY